LDSKLTPCGLITKKASQKKCSVKLLGESKYYPLIPKFEKPDENGIFFLATNAARILWSICGYAIF